MDGQWLVGGLAFAGLFGIGSGAIANAKGRSFLGYFLLGFFFAFFGLLIAIGMPPLKTEALARQPAKPKSIAFKGDRDIASDEYQLYLVEKYKIKKNETLNKFVFGKKLFATIDTALHAAHLEDRESQMKTGGPNLTENQVEWYNELVALEFGQSIIINGDKITKNGELFGAGSYYFCGSSRYRTAEEVIAEYKIK